MNKWLMTLLAAMILGATFTGSSYFVSKEQDVQFGCYIPPNVLRMPTYNTYHEIERGYPYTFYTKNSAPKSDGCQSIDVPSNPIVASTSFSETGFAIDVAIWSSAFFVLGALLVGVRKKK